MTGPETGAAPRPLAERLGLKPGQSVALVGVSDEGLITLVRGASGTATPVSLPRGIRAGSEPPPLPGLGDGRDLVFFQAETAESLALLPRLVEALEPDGALWVLWPKGRREIGQSAVMAAGLAAGVVDVKVVSASERLSGLKFVFRLVDRAKRGG